MPGFPACPTGRCPAASSRSTAAGDSSRELARRSTRDSPPVISACAHLARLSRAGIVFAREGVLGLIDPTPLPWSARAVLRLARVLERHTSEGAALRLA